MVGPPMTFLWQNGHPDIVKRRKELVKKAGLSKAAEDKTWDELTASQKKAIMEAYHPKAALKKMTTKDFDKMMADSTPDENLLDDILKE